MHIITTIAIALFSTSAMAQGPDPEVKSVTDMLKPSAGKARRACRMEIDGTRVPCELVWYIEFKDGTHAVQFNKADGSKPMVSFGATEGDPNTIKVDIVLLRTGDRSVATHEIEATGLCHISKAAMACQARLRDGRVIVGSIFVGGAR